MRKARKLASPMMWVWSLALAFVASALVYFSITALPYLAFSSATDATFGNINACLMASLSSRVGFAVAFDAQSAAAFSNESLSKCNVEGVAQVWPLGGITAAAFDRQGRLWAATGAANVDGARLFLAKADGVLEPKGTVQPQTLVGIDEGVVALEASGRLLSVNAEGSVTGLVELGFVPQGLLANSDGRRLAFVADERLVVLDSVTLRLLHAESPCRVEHLWWRKEPAWAVMSCGPNASWALEVNVETGEAHTAVDKHRVQSILAGPNGPWVEPCDNLPCTADEP